MHRLLFRAARRRAEYNRGRPLMPTEPPLTSPAESSWEPEAEPHTPPEYRLLGDVVKQLVTGQADASKLRDAGDDRRHAEILAALLRLCASVKDHDDNEQRRSDQVLTALSAAVDRVETTVDTATDEGRKAGAAASVKGAFDALGKLPMLVQIILVLVLYQGSGLLYEKLLGHPPPQVTIPTALTGQPIHTVPESP